MTSGCYLVFVRNEENGCLRISTTGDPYDYTRRLAERSGCSMRLIFAVGYPDVEEAVSRRDILKLALDEYLKNFSVNGKNLSKYSSWYIPEAWNHFLLDEEELEEAVEELYRFYDGKNWSLRDSFPE